MIKERSVVNHVIDVNGVSVDVDIVTKTSVVINSIDGVKSCDTSITWKLLAKTRILVKELFNIKQ